MNTTWPSGWRVGPWWDNRERHICELDRGRRAGLERYTLLVSSEKALHTISADGVTAVPSSQDLQLSLPSTFFTRVEDSRQILSISGIARRETDRPKSNISR